MCVPVDMVLSWKSEREQHYTRTRELAKERKQLVIKAGTELQELAQTMVLGQARQLHNLVAERVLGLQDAASRAVQVFFQDVSTSEGYCPLASVACAVVVLIWYCLCASTQHTVT